jgi:hypothetical protein
MEVVRTQSFPGHLLLSQSFHALRTQSRVEFTFLNTVAGRKPNEGRAEKCTPNPQAEKKQESAQCISEKFSGFFAFDHVQSTLGRMALGHSLGLRIVFFFHVIHAAVRFRKKLFS